MATSISIANGSAAATVGWMPGPDGRGTFSLVISCLLTLSLCVWSAMHLNIPPHDGSLAESCTRHLRWGLVGIFAPELVVYTAWRQHNSARKLHERVSPRISASMQAEKNSSVARKHPWTMVHSFYAGMGGFIIQLDGLYKDQGPQFIPESHRLTISARGIAFLAECGQLPDIPEDDIVDKSKADGLAKLLVCFQAGHVLCALVIYILWWHKPRLVHEPTTLSGDWIKPLYAYMFMSSQISGFKRNHAGTIWQARGQSEASAVGFYTSGTKFDTATSNPIETSSVIQMTKSFGPRTSQDASQEDDVISRSTTQAIDNLTTHFFAPRPLQGPLTESYELAGVTEQAQTLNAMQAERWRLAAEVIRLYPVLYNRLGATREAESRQWAEMMPEELLTRSASNWPAEDLLRGTEGVIIGMTLWCISVAYGAIHIAAWNDYFPSIVEQWLWRSSAIYISFSGLLWLFINLIAHEWKAFDAYWDRVLMYEAHWTTYAFLGTVCSICGVAYMFARTYLVVEAFISIRELPLATYDTPDWMNFVPFW